MLCSKAQRLISRRVDGLLDEAAGVALKGHLQGCSACRAFAERVDTLELDSLDVTEPSPDFTARVVRRLDDVPVRRRSALYRPAFYRPVAAGLGIAAALGGFVVGSLFEFADPADSSSAEVAVEVAAGDATDPMAEDSVESVLIAMLSKTGE